MDAGAKQVSQSVARLLANRLQLGLTPGNRRRFWAVSFSEGAAAMFLTLWPLYITSLGASPPQVGLALASRSLGALVFLLISGMIADRLTPRLMVVGFRSLFVVGMVLVSLAWDWWVVIPASMFIAAATMAWPTVSRTVAADAEDGPARLRAFTLIYSVGPSLAYLLTPVLAGLIAENLALRAVFPAAGILGAVAVLIFAITPMDLPASDSGPEAGLGRVLRVRQARRLYLLAFGTILAMTLGSSLAPVLLEEVHGISAGSIGLLASITAIGSILLGLSSGRLAVLRIPFAIYGVAVAGLGVYLTILISGNAIWHFAPGYLMLGATYLVWPLLYNAVSDAVPDRLRSRAYALVDVSFFLGLTAAPALAGWLYDLQPQLPALVGLALLPVLLAGGYIAFRVPSAPPPTSRTTPPAPELQQQPTVPEQALP